MSKINRGLQMTRAWFVALKGAEESLVAPFCLPKRTVKRVIGVFSTVDMHIDGPLHGVN